MDASDVFRLRRCLLTTLYDSFRSMPYLQMEPEQLRLACRVTLEQLNWNLVYLEKCGYVELSKTYAPADQVASAVSITVGGIDLVENDVEFGKRFP